MARKQAPALGVLTVMWGETAGDVNSLREPTLIPRPLRLRWRDSQLAEVSQEVDANINAFPADVALTPLEESLNLTLAEPAERTACEEFLLTRIRWAAGRAGPRQPLRRSIRQPIRQAK